MGFNWAFKGVTGNTPEEDQQHDCIVSDKLWNSANNTSAHLKPNRTHSDAMTPILLVPRGSPLVQLRYLSTLHTTTADLLATLLLSAISAT